MRRNSKKIILISIIVIMFIAIAIAVYIYFGTDTFKSAQEMFQKYTVKTVSAVDLTSDNMAMDFAKKQSSNSFETNDKVTISATGKNVSKELNKVVGNIETKVDQTGKYKSTKASVDYDSNTLFSFGYVEDSDKVAIALPQIVNKFLSVKKDEVKDFAGKFNMNVDMNKDSNVNLSDFMTFTDEQKNTLASTYLNAISSTIPASAYTKQSKVNTMINSVYVEAKTYSVTLNNLQYDTCMKNVLETAKNDTYLAELIKNKAKNLGVNNLSDEDIQNFIQKYVEIYDKKVENEANPTDEACRILLYVQSGKVCKVDIYVGEDLYTITVLKNTTSDIQLNINVQKKTTDENDEIKTDIYSVDVEKLVKDTSVGFSANVSQMIDGTSTPIYGVKYAITKNSDTEYQTDMQTNFVNSNNTYTIALNGKTTFKDSVEVTKLDDTTCVDLNTYDKDTLSQLFISIMDRLNTIFTEAKEDVLFNNSSNSANDIKCEKVNNLSVPAADKAAIQKAVQQRGYFMYKVQDKTYVIVSSGVKSTGEYTLNLDNIKTKGNNIEINVDEKYVDDYASNSDNPTIVYPFMVLELSTDPDFLMVRNDSLRYEFQEIDFDAIKDELASSSEPDTITNTTDTTNTATNTTTAAQ